MKRKCYGYGESLSLNVFLISYISMWINVFTPNLRCSVDVNHYEFICLLDIWTGKLFLPNKEAYKKRVGLGAESLLFWRVSLLVLYHSTVLQTSFSFGYGVCQAETSYIYQANTKLWKEEKMGQIIILDSCFFFSTGSFPGYFKEDRSQP